MRTPMIVAACVLGAGCVTSQMQRLDPESRPARAPETVAPRFSSCADLRLGRLRSHRPREPGASAGAHLQRQGRSGAPRNVGLSLGAGLTRILAGGIQDGPSVLPAVRLLDAGVAL